MGLGSRSPAPSLRLSDLIHKWWNVHGHTLASGADTYKRLLAFAEFVKNPKLAKFDAAVWSRYRQARLNAATAPSTLNRELCSLRAMFSEMERLGEFPGPNPLLRVRALRVPQTDLRALSSDEWERLYAECRASTNADLPYVALLAYLTGARWGELEALRLSDFGADFVRIRGESAKNGKARVIPLAPGVVAWVSQGRKLGSLFGSCYAAFRSAVERSGVELPEGQLAHVLRHTFASGFLARGGSLTELREFLGHGSISVTSRYLHLVPGECRSKLALPGCADAWLNSG
jgi:integrase